MRRLLLVAAVGAAATIPGSASAADSLYWGNFTPKKISWVALDATIGGDLSTTGATVNGPTGTAIDAAAGRVYWANYSANKISWTKLDGSGGGDLVTTGATVASPLGIAIDPTAGRVYWANSGANKISFANVNGSGGGDLTTTGATVSAPEGVAVDPAAGRIYWANFNANKISFANLSGTGGGDLTTTGATVSGPDGLAVDPAAGRVYWSNFAANKISWAKLDGTGGADLNTAGATVSSPEGMAIDAAAGRVYFANQTGNKVSYVRTDGTGGGDVATLTATIATPEFPALLKKPEGANAPAITGATAIGSALTCAPGTWAPDILPAFLYRVPQTTAIAWTRDNVAIAGATSATLTADQAGAYRCVSSAANQAGATTQTSPPLTVAAGGSTTPTTPTTTPTTPSTGTPSNRVSIGSVNGRSLTLQVGSAGTVRVTGPRKLLRTSTAKGGPGRVAVPLKLTTKAKRTLRRSHRLRLAVQVRFTPTGGTAATRGRTIIVKG